MRLGGSPRSRAWFASHDVTTGVFYNLAPPSAAPLSAAAHEFARIAKQYMREIRPKVRGP